MRFFIFVLLLVDITACSIKDKHPALHVSFIQYSEFVKDSFNIQVQLPKEYFSKPEKKYPVVVLLDGNFYFPIFSAVLHQYETAELLQPTILVGIGYNSFKAMDSLRVRDYLYPKALPSDELPAIGGGQRFKAYITKELLPKVDAEFRTEKETRSLLGHSFGGYFVLYSLLDQLKNETDDFKTFVSASPTLWYNNFYLSEIPQQFRTAEHPRIPNLFLSVGALEDSTWSVKPVKVLTNELLMPDGQTTHIQSKIYSHLDHMDVAILSFTKGLQEFSKE